MVSLTAVSAHARAALVVRTTAKAVYISLGDNGLNLRRILTLIGEFCSVVVQHSVASQLDL